jgi:Uma2 family endonuclease
MPETADRFELVRGMLVVAPRPGGAHQSVASLLLSALTQVALDSGGLALGAPTGVALTAEIGYEPDVLYLSKARMARFRRRGIDGAPDLVVEVLSARTRRYDLEVKLADYLANGVLEVWIADPVARTVSVHRRDEARPQTVASGEQVPSRLVDVGTAHLDRAAIPRD